MANFIFHSQIKVWCQLHASSFPSCVIFSSWVIISAPLPLIERIVCMAILSILPGPKIFYNSAASNKYHVWYLCMCLCVFVSVADLKSGLRRLAWLGQRVRGDLPLPSALALYESTPYFTCLTPC